jgi:hypothetical protein
LFEHLPTIIQFIDVRAYYSWMKNHKKKNQACDRVWDLNLVNPWCFEVWKDLEGLE